MPKVVTRQLSLAKPEIKDADLLLFAGKGIVSRFIRSFGRGRYSHAAKASWLKGELFCLEVREWHGGRAVTLGSQVKKYPGQIDVFRANAIGLPTEPCPTKEPWPTPCYNRAKSDELMLMFAGVEYGYFDILATAMLHFWGIRLFATANVDDEFVSTRPPYCSAACAIADRIGGGVDPVPMLADKITEPSDLARSPFYRYMFTLVPDEEPKTPTGETNAAAEKIVEAESVIEPVPITEIVAAKEGENTVN
jgi:hypothetical protein